MRNISLILGAAVWIACILVGCRLGWTVYSRTLRPVVTMRIPAPVGHSLSRGDTVFLATNAGLRRVGEVASVEDGVINLAIGLQIELGDTEATCWRTPLSAKGTVSAILPPDIQELVAGHISQVWQELGDEIIDTWKPIVAGLTSEYLRLIGGDLRVAVRSRREDIRDLGQRHLLLASKDWPMIQRRMLPILQEHLVPVLGKLAGDAFSEAPKTGFAWDIAAGQYDSAYSRMLDWLGKYISDMPDEDRRELDNALLATCEAMWQDKPLMHCLGEVGRRLRDDKEVVGIAVDIWREVVAGNPRTASFLRDRIVNDPSIRQEVYRTIELLGPTTRNVLTEVLFDDGITRPEIVHFVRSAALGRKVSWVTLKTRDSL